MPRISTATDITSNVEVRAGALVIDGVRVCPKCFEDAHSPFCCNALPALAAELLAEYLAQRVDNKSLADITFGGTR